MAKKKLRDKNSNEVKIHRPFYKKWWFIALVIFFIIAAFSDSEEAVNEESAVSESKVTDTDETEDYKVSPGNITNRSLLISLSVRAETIIEQYDDIDNVYVNQDEIEAYKMTNFENDETGEVYENVYSIDGVYSWNDKKYDFEWVSSFDENDVNVGGSILQYTSDMMKDNQINVDRSAVE